MTTEKRVINVIKNLCNEKSITKTKELIKDLSFDSFNLVTLLLEIEEEFSIRLNESDMNPFELVTVNDVVNLAKKYVSAKNKKTKTNNKK